MTPMKLVYCFALMKIPVHRMSGYQLLTSLPAQLITDVDSMPLCLAFCPITGGFCRIYPLDKMLFRTRTLVHLELRVLRKNIVPESSCYSQIILFMRSPMHCQTTKHTEIVVESIQRIQTFLGPQPFRQTPFPHMQRLVVQNYLDLDRDIAIECICVGPSECFSFQPCSFLSLYPASCLL